MSPFERGDGGGIPESGERIKIRHRGRSGVSTVVVIGKERLVILPVNGIGLFVGDVNDGGDGLEPGHVRIQKTYIVDKKSVSTGPTKRPVLIWRNDAQDKKP